jgi:hypothetical protein
MADLRCFFEINDLCPLVINLVEYLHPHSRYECCYLIPKIP